MIHNPSTLHLEPTTNCNLHCPQCGRYSGVDPNPRLRAGELSLNDIKQIIPVKLIKNLTKMFMCGNYGDPAAAQDCLEIFRYFREINPTITLGMNTNGSLRNPAWWADLASIMNRPLDYVVWSIDGLEDTNHVYRQNSNWAKIMENAAAFIAAGGSAHWDMLVFEHNKHQVEDAKALAASMGFTWFRSKETTRPVPANVTWIKKVSETHQLPTEVIDCEAIREQSIYLSAHGEWLPCCYIASQTDRAVPNETTAMFRGNYELATYEQAVASKAFSEVTTRWGANPLPVCAAACSVADSGVRRARSKWKSEVQLR